MKAARAWINKKLRSGVPKQELLNCVGAFSNRKKEVVMREKNLTEAQYKKRYDFLFKVYNILTGG